MTVIDIERTTSTADACVVALHPYREANGKRRHDHRTKTGDGVAHVATDWRDDAQDLAKEITRLLDRVGECLALATHRTHADDIAGVPASASGIDAVQGTHGIFMRPAGSAIGTQT